MPIYLYKCDRCQARRQVFKKLALLNCEEKCEICTTAMARQVTAAAVVGDYAPYDCPITGDRIEGRRAHEENLRKHGCRVYEPGETEAFKRRRAADEAAFEESVEATVDEFIARAPAEKREALAIAEQVGITAEVGRPDVNL
jgi:putative FmdB family regulatory protein